MKNALFYYYQVAPLKIVKKKNTYIFEDEDYCYYLCVVDKPIDYMKELLLFNTLIRSFKFMEIVFNINREALSYINGRYYILCRDFKDRVFNISDLVNPYYCNAKMANLKLLNHSDWGILWSRKIDYFEYQKDFIKVKYPLLYKSLDYFIGLSENAISYFNAVNSYFNKEYTDGLVVARRRVDLFSYTFYLPLNLIIDHKSRDVAGYLKYLFISDNYNYEEIEYLINILNYSNYQYSLLMARLLFPSFYFDLYENIINGVIKEKKIVRILDRSDEYERFLRSIYQLINKKKSILKIDWLEVVN